MTRQRESKDSRRYTEVSGVAAPLRPSRPAGQNAQIINSLALDYPLLAILATLLVLGLVMVYSASVGRYGANYFLAQLKWVALGLLVMTIMAFIPYRVFQRYAIPIMGIALLGLALVLVFGEERYGARRTFGGSIQPSEIAKLAVIIYVAAWVASKGKRLAQVEAGLAPFAVLMGIVTGLLLLEPSFSVAIIILLTGVGIFFLGGGDARQMLISGLMGAGALLLLLWQSGYGFDRITVWWQGLSDPNQMSYNVRQALLLQQSGNGSLLEHLLDKNMVPLLWSDYLFANIVDDLGVFGGAGVVLLYAALGYRILTIALNAPDQFSGLAAAGVAIWFLAQAAIHIGSSLALIPPTGQPLPFMSYGGSAMLSCMAAVGLLLNISRAQPAKKAPYADSVVRGRDGGARLPASDRGRGTGKATEHDQPKAAPSRRNTRRS